MTGKCKVKLLIQIIVSIYLKKNERKFLVFLGKIEKIVFFNNLSSFFLAGVFFGNFKVRNSEEKFLLLSGLCSKVIKFTNFTFLKKIKSVIINEI